MIYPIHFEPRARDRKRRRLLLYLHGLAEIGGDLPGQVTKHGPWRDGECVRNRYVRSDLDDFFRVGPHLNHGDWDVRRLIATLRNVKEEHEEYIRPAGLCVAGISLGGKAALELAAALEEPLTAVAVFCPATVDRLPDAITKAPVFLFHAADDDRVPLDGSRRKLYEDLSSNARFHWRELKKEETMRLAGKAHPHVCWTHVFGHPDLYAWFRQGEGPCRRAFERIPFST